LEKNTQKDLEYFKDLTLKLFREEDKTPVVQPVPTDQVIEYFDLSVKEDGLSRADWEKLVEHVVLATPRTATKLFFNQLFGGRQSKAMLGDLLAVVLNNSMYTYKVAGPQAGIEKTMIHTLCNMVGFEGGDGTIAPGGSLANLMGMIMGRDASEGDAHNQGVTGKMTVYTSKSSHYSIPKNAAFMGVGREQVRYVEVTEKGEMDVEELARQIEKDKNEGFIPAVIIATAGTTVLGAFDSIEDIAPVAKENNVWLHVDGAYCGGVIFSNEYRRLVKGIGKADSFSFNAHKMLGTPLSCSLFLTKHKDQLFNSFSNAAEYLYQTGADNFDLGKTSLQCGRRNDALKFWCLWKSIGTKGLEEMVDHLFYQAEVARTYCQNNPNYTLYSYPDSISVCFNYKNIDPKKLCTLLYEEGALMVGYGQHKDQEFVRLVLVNANNSKEDILRFFEILEKSAAAL
jgi:glutamate/tyrosine decarboxylase-like PLP-dependent enzyme